MKFLQLLNEKKKRKLFALIFTFYYIGMYIREKVKFIIIDCFSYKRSFLNEFIRFFYQRLKITPYLFALLM